jgi:hypothetical protein
MRLWPIAFQMIVVLELDSQAYIAYIRQSHSLFALGNFGESNQLGVIDQKASECKPFEVFLPFRRDAGIGSEVPGSIFLLFSHISEDL